MVPVNHGSWSHRSKGRGKRTYPFVLCLSWEVEGDRTLLNNENQNKQETFEKNEVYQETFENLSYAGQPESTLGLP